MYWNKPPVCRPRGRINLNESMATLPSPPAETGGNEKGVRKMRLSLEHRRQCQPTRALALLWAALFLFASTAWSSAAPWKILWFNADTGSVSFWDMNDFTPVSSHVLASDVPAPWHLFG